MSKKHFILYPVAIIFSLIAGMGIGSSNQPKAAPVPSVSTVVATPTEPVKGTPPTAPETMPTKMTVGAMISGNDLVHVGEDIPAGTYRVMDEVAGMNCYWMKSKDAEGTDIIANANPEGGKPQVTLKKGEWFTSEGCPIWTKK